MSELLGKKELRRTLRERRRAYVTHPDQAAHLFVACLMVAERVTEHFGDARTVAAYISDGEEVDPLPILFQAIGRGLHTVLPRMESLEALPSFRHWVPGDELVRGPSGILQPHDDAPIAEPDLICAPLLGFDRRMNRLGQGAAFYDRAFAALPRARRIGIAWSVQEVPELPTDAWDMPLHAVATEAAWITDDMA